MISRERNRVGSAPCRTTIRWVAGLLSAAGIGCSASFGQNTRSAIPRLYDTPQTGIYGGLATGGAGYDNRPFSPFVGGNAFATGNARGGLSLRSFSPIGDATAFRGSLGSGSLSDFIRDSVSPYDANRSGALGYGGGYGQGAFYDPARTAPTAGFLRGQTAPQGLSGLSTPNDFASRATPGLLNYGGPQARANPGGTSAAAAQDSRIANGWMSSSIFGITPIKPVQPAPIGQLSRTPSIGERLAPKSMQTPDPLAPEGPSGTGRADLRVTARRGVEPLGAPLDLVLKGDARTLLSDARITNRPDANSLARMAMRRPDSGARDTPPATASLPPTLPNDRSMLPGQDVFTDMRLALALKADPGASWFREMQGAAAGVAKTQQQQQAAALAATEFIERLTKSPIKTFVNDGPSPLNDELLKAESLLRVGEYYEAAARYARASVFDPSNPLPLVGRGHALLAAGDYLSASHFLLRGLERFPELTQFDVDLREFLGSGEIIDIRRADIMKQLELHDDVALRFLLGYLEYYTGDHEHGLANLELASKAAQPGSLIQRFPGLLRGEATLPLPKPVDGAAPAAPVLIPNESHEKVPE